jgi:hypothetical protein
MLVLFFFFFKYSGRKIIREMLFSILLRSSFGILFVILFFIFIFLF